MITIVKNIDWTATPRGKGNGLARSLGPALATACSPLCSPPAVEPAHAQNILGIVGALMDHAMRW